jgi:hypothetical protein
MKEAWIHDDVSVPTHHEAPAISPPGERPFDFPAALIASQLAPVLPRRLHSVLSMGANQLETTPSQAPAPRIRVAGFLVNPPVGLLPWAPRTVTGHGYRLQCRFQQGSFRRGRRVQEVSHRHTWAVDHHPPLRALAAFGLPDPGPPCFAGAKLPSANASDQSQWPWASSWAKKARQTLSHTSCASPSRQRRQQVLGDGKRSGRSCQRAPVRKIQRRPSKTGRFGVGFGPPRGEALSSGNKGALFSPCASVRSAGFLAIGRDAFRRILQRKESRNANASLKGL